MNNSPIGVMDSGAGGLTVASVLRRLYPEETILYYGDSARNPYGEKTPEEIRRFATEVRDYLIGRGVKAVIIACNTITFNVKPSFYKAKVPVTGMSLDFSALPDVQKIAVFATPASIATHSHKGGVEKVRPHADVIEVPCDGLAHAIETMAPEDEIRRLIASLIDMYGAGEAEAAIFGCTHYPLVRRIFEELMPHTFFLDPAEKTVEQAMTRLKAEGALAEKRGTDHFYFSTQPELAEKLAGKAMGTQVSVTLPE